MKLILQVLVLWIRFFALNETKISRCPLRDADFLWSTAHLFNSFHLNVRSYKLNSNATYQFLQASKVHTNMHLKKKKLIEI